MNQAQPSVNPFTLDFIKKLEGYTPAPKWDYKQYSIGHGTRWNPGDPVGTKADHEAALAREAGNVSQWLDQNVTTQLQPNQRAALVSAGFNLGTGEKGLGRLLGDINSGNWNSVARRLPTFNKAGGQVNKGLINRRAAEVEMLTGRKPSGYIGGTAAAPAQTVPAQMPPEALVQPSGRHSKLADMLMASAAGAKPRGWGDLLNAGGDLALGYTMGEKADTRQQEYQSKLSQMLSGADPNSMAETLIKSGDPALMQAGVQAKMQQAQAQAKANAPLRGKERFMSTPGGVMDVETMQIVPGTEKDDGNQPIKVGDRLVQKGPDGKYVDVYAPPGAGAESGGLSPTALKEREKAIGKAQGEAAAALPGALQKTESMVSAVDDLLKDPGLDRVTGPVGSWIPNISPAANRALSRIEQIQGKTFLQAFESLKGGGQITEVEGAKAEAALARLGSTDLSDADYKQALKDLRSEIASLYDLAQDRAGVPPEQRKTIPPLQGDQTQEQPKSAPPAPAVQFLQQNPSPEIIEQFNRKYGPGAAEGILGNQPPMTGVSP